MTSGTWRAPIGPGSRSCVRRFTRGRLRLYRANAVGLADFAGYSPQQLLDLLDRSSRPRGLTTALDGRTAARRGVADPRTAVGRNRFPLDCRTGPEIRGPGEAMLMCTAGRPDVVDELDGPGRATLRRRIGG
ncbi:MAG TPA: hypothetical protein VF299_02355 [Mycobacterium sp.]